MTRPAAKVLAELDSHDRVCVSGAGFTPYNQQVHDRLMAEWQAAKAREEHQCPGS